MSTFTPEQQAKIREIIEGEPCLFNARHKRDYVTMMAWLNEVGGKQLATVADLAEIMADPPGARFDPMTGVWRAPPEAPAADDKPAGDPWQAQRAALGDAIKGA